MPRPTRAWRSEIPRLSQFAVDHLLLLPLGALIALVWVNAYPESYYRVTYQMSFVVNDVAMTFFFALMAKEVVEATAPGGVLHSWRRVSLPVAAAIGATVVPALLYRRTVDLLEEPMLAVGWPVSLAIDLAASYFVARVIFGRHPVIPFLLLLAIASDVLGFLALALVDPALERHFGTGALIMAVALALAFGFRRVGVARFWPYLLGPGSIAWFALYWTGLHPALALVLIVPFLPHAARDPGFLVDAQPTARDALSQFEIWCRYPAHVTLFFFGLVNAGVSVHALEPGTWGLPIALIVGRPVGILLAVAIAAAVGLRLPDRVGWRELIVVGFTAAISFSIGLFICTALLPAGQLRAEVSMGVLLSLLGGPIALAAAKLLRVGRFAH